MTYEMVYQRLCVIRDKNYADPADFANDVLSLMASFERKQAAEQERALDLPSAAVGCRCFVSIESYNKCPVHGTANQ